MRLGKYLSSLNKPELEELKDQLNLTDDEEMVFCQLSKGRSNVTAQGTAAASMRKAPRTGAERKTEWKTEWKTQRCLLMKSWPKSWQK